MATSDRDTADNPALARLVLANIDRLGDGEAGDMLRRAIETCLADLKEYGRDRQTRKVTIELGFKQPQPGGRVQVSFKAVAVTPRPTTKVTVGYFDKSADPAVLFNPASAREPDQLILPGLGSES